MSADLLWAGSAVVALILFGLFLGPILWRGVILLGAVTFLLGLGTLVYQCVQAIHAGYWTPWEFGETLATVGLSDLSSSSDGTGSVVRWIMTLPIGLGLAVTGFLIVWIGTLGKSAAQGRESQRRFDR